ncbi:MAG: hypothetical protein ACI9RG_000390 [Sulfurimonas sp.]|jgi:hypothetical protein
MSVKKVQQTVETVKELTLYKQQLPNLRIFSRFRRSNSFFDEKMP